MERQGQKQTLGEATVLGYPRAAFPDADAQARLERKYNHHRSDHDLKRCNKGLFGQHERPWSQSRHRNTRKRIGQNMNNNGKKINALLFFYHAPQIFEILACANGNTLQIVG